MGSLHDQVSAIFYFLALLFARLAGSPELGLVFGGWGSTRKGCKQDQANMKYPTLEKIALVLHYSFGWVMSNMAPLNAIAYFLVAQTVCGLFLAVVFGLGHNGMAVYPADQRPDFWAAGVHTRNVTSNMFVDWFCGGLQYQVDHQFFPSLPRHNLPKVHELVHSFCKDQGVTYHETNMWVGTKEVLSTSLKCLGSSAM